MLGGRQFPDLGYWKEMGRAFGGMPRDSREEPASRCQLCLRGGSLKG